MFWKRRKTRRDVSHTPRGSFVFVRLSSPEGDLGTLVVDDLELEAEGPYAVLDARIRIRTAVVEPFHRAGQLGVPVGHDEHVELLVGVALVGTVLGPAMRLSYPQGLHDLGVDLLGALVPGRPGRPPHLLPFLP